MNKFKKITNRELLTELEQRLANFDQSEFTILVRLVHEYEQELMKVIRDNNPQAYDWIQEKRQELEQEKTDKKIKELAKSLDKK